MTETVNLYVARTNLSKLVDRAAAGEAIIIAKAGKPKAKLVPCAAMLDPANDVFVSAASVWEIAIKRASGKLRLTAKTVAHHGAPFDRMLIAQAMLEGMVLGTRDAMAR